MTVKNVRILSAFRPVVVDSPLGPILTKTWFPRLRAEELGGDVIDALTGEVLASPTRFGSRA